MAGPVVPRVVARPLRRAEHRLLLVTGDLICGVAAMFLALWLWSIPAGAQLSAAFVSGHAAWFIGAAVWLLVAGFPAASPGAAFSIRRTAVALVRGGAVVALLYIAAYFYAPRGQWPRLVVLYFLWEAALLTLAWRLLFIAIFSRRRFRPCAIVVGSGPGAEVAIDIARRCHMDVQPPVAVAAEDLAAVITEREVSEIVLALQHAPKGAVLHTLLSCQEAGIELVRVQTLVEQHLRRVPVDLLEPDWLMTDLADAVRLREPSWIGKRVIDIAGGAIGLAAAAMATPLIALAIRIESSGPVFYRQKRLGLGGAPFEMVKFRTMAEGAEQPGEARWAGPKDPRVTRVGRFLRKMRLDELPQFLSVLRGEMSLVGPRPEREEFVAQLQEEIPFYRARLMVPPGLTGWAQVMLPYGDSVDAAKAKLEYDLYYIKHRSVMFDLSIIVRTIATVVQLRGV